jgi:L-ascorbate metabolism protein UlaG (beta-lactamase superfamily)
MLKVGALTVSYLEHDCFRLEAGGTVLYTDPFRIRKQEKKADFVTISHDHYDHMSEEDLSKVLKPSTMIVASFGCLGKLDREGRAVHYLKPGEVCRSAGIVIEAVPAYNTSKYRSPGHVFHEKSSNFAGFVIEMGGARVYHAGDTDLIEEMEALGKVDVALLPVSGTFVMTAEEAIEAARKISPGVAVPMHWGSIVGGRNDAEKFVRGFSTSGKAQLLEKE